MRSWPIFVLACAAVFGQQQAQEPGLTRDGSFWVYTTGRPISGPLPPRLLVSGRAHIVVRGGPGDQITYRLTQRVRNSNQWTARGMMGQLVTNHVARDVVQLSIQASPAVQNELEVTVPHQVSMVMLDSPYGDLEAYDFSGSVQAVTHGGSIRMDRVQGDVSGRTAGGEIRFGKIGGAVHCSTGAGAVTIEGSGGETNCASAGGDIYVRDGGGPVTLSTEGNIHVDRAAGAVEAHSSGGMIDVGQAGGVVVADTLGGSIQVGSSRGVKAETMRGMVRVRSAAGPMNVAAMAGNILAELLAGTRMEDSFFAATDGDITVLIPSNLALRIMATNEGGGMARIVSDFKEVRTRGTDFGFVAPPVLAEGSINGGGPVLRLNVSSGVIYLRKIK